MSEQVEQAPSIIAVVLAAGASSRMGAHKLLLPLGGLPLMAWATLAACASQANDVFLVLGREAPTALASLPQGRYQTLVNAAYEQGQGTSLALALAHAPAATMGAVVVLADQPFMTAAAIDRVLTAARQEPDRIVLGISNGRAGHPVYLPRRVFGELLALSGDIGAREIVARERDSAQRAPLHDDLAQFDVDTAEDYQRALSLADRLPAQPS